MARNSIYVGSIPRWFLCTRNAFLVAKKLSTYPYFCFFFFFFIRKIAPAINSIPSFCIVKVFLDVDAKRPSGNSLKAEAKVAALKGFGRSELVLTSRKVNAFGLLFRHYHVPSDFFRIFFTEAVDILRCRKRYRVRR